VEMHSSIAKALLKVAPHYRDTWYTAEYLAKAIIHEYDLDDGALTSKQLANAISKSPPFNTGLGSGQGVEIDDKTMMYQGLYKEPNGKRLKFYYVTDKGSASPLKGSHPWYEGVDRSRQFDKEGEKSCSVTEDETKSLKIELEPVPKSKSE
jgi:hypothetical protein